MDHHNFRTKPEHDSYAAFTLIELSIVLVIIGLIVGGVLAGKDLISAAAVRAQISQLEKFHTAANTFRGKYNAYPGDINAASAATFGLPARNTFPSGGNENGIIEGYCCGMIIGIRQDSEIMAFWQDLITAKMITDINSSYDPVVWSLNPVTTISDYIPNAKIGSSNYVYLYNGGTTGNDAGNYFGIS